MRHHGRGWHAECECGLRQLLAWCHSHSCPVADSRTALGVARLAPGPGPCGLSQPLGRRRNVANAAAIVGPAAGITACPREHARAAQLWPGLWLALRARCRDPSAARSGGPPSGRVWLRNFGAVALGLARRCLRRGAPRGGKHKRGALRALCTCGHAWIHRGAAGRWPAAQRPGGPALCSTGPVRCGVRVRVWAFLPRVVSGLGG
mmetsp:Transcript_89342/g.248139  ORF Transcript_89342/g.248139 Transcript_89342/m.248139 type:complete len:205 (-) Transcript_89342:708-1322(-)